MFSGATPGGSCVARGFNRRALELFSGGGVSKTGSSRSEDAEEVFKKNSRAHGSAGSAGKRRTTAIGTRTPMAFALCDWRRAWLC